MSGARSRRRARWAALLGLLAALSCAGEETTADRSIESSELAARIASGTAPVILDVRTPEEFAAGHVPGALNVPHGELAARLGSLAIDPDAEVVVHCELGGRAELAESVLLEAGFSNVRDLSGHMQAWRAAGHPIE